jgi:hypothetical protein
MAESPFDPFNIGDDDKDERVASPVTTKTKTTTTTTAANSTIISSGSCSTSTSRTTNKNSTAKISTENLRRPNPKPLPPRMNVRFTLHEEVTSSALFDQSCEGGSLSQLFIEGKVVVSIICCENGKAVISIPNRYLCVRCYPCFFCCYVSS